MIEVPEKDLNRLLGDTQGLLLGATVTLHPGVTADLRAALDLPVSTPARTLHEALFEKADSGMPPADLRLLLNTALDKMSTGPTTRALARIPWKAVLSATPDLRFEELFRQESDRHPHRPTPSVLNELAKPVPPRSAPVFKLGGTVGRPEFAVTRNQLLQRKAQWRTALRSFFDLTRGAPTLVVGMDESIDILRDLLVDMMSQPNLRPRFLAFFADDPLSNNREIVALFDSFSKFCLIAAPTTSIQKASPSTEGASPASDGTSKYIDLGAIHNLVVVVNDHLLPSSSRTERHRLLDLLFSPDVPNWEPFAHKMDFTRTSSHILADIKTALATAPFVPSAVVVVGAAASGKTVLLKRLAYDLATAGRTVLWLRSAMYPDTSDLLANLFRSVQKATTGQRVVIVMDDPASFVALTPRDVALAARAANLEFILLTAARTSEWLVQDSSTFVGPLPVVIKEDLPDRLDEAELASFPDYLVDLGIYSNRSLAETAIRAVLGNSAVDVLSTLYWLLPQTKASIAASVRDEYFRLGDVSGLSRVLIGALNKTSKLLRDAYEYVAVANHYRASLPVEVLVATLEVGYDEWMDAIPPGPAWGLLYGDGDASSESLSYRTRNDVVTQILMSAINGGAVNRSSELRLLERLLAGCSGSSSVYREFCVKILVHNEAVARLDFQEGLRLFDQAIAALPIEDRTLLHHKALWLRKKGRDPMAATPVFEKALAASPYPYASQGEPDEHIHNSIAANTIDMIERGLIDATKGRAQAMEHLALARSSQFFNTHSAHVHANMILSLLNLTQTGEVADITAMSARALSDLDTTLLTVRGGDSEHACSSEEDIHLLKSVRAQLLGRLKPLSDLKQDATAQWKERGNQSGFVVVGLKALDEARLGSRGSDYHQAYAYVEEAMATVRAAGSEISAALAEVALLIYYTWRVIRRIPTRNQANVIDWETIRSLSAVALKARRGGQDSYNQYLHGLSLAQLGRWADSQAVFGALRQLRIPPAILWLRRDFLLDANGTATTVQGVVRVGPENRIYLNATELGTDFPGDRNETWPRSGNLAFAKIAFSFGGQTAIPTTSRPQK
jgi:hypothetical protein